MTQTLDVRDGIAERSHVIGTPVSTATAATSKFGTFAITFGIAFPILYTLFEQMNWPLFTYHPAVGKVDFWMQRPRSGEGPPMYWFGWLALSFPAAALLGWIATVVPRQWLHRATIFGCVLALLWTALFALGVVIADRATFDADFLKLPWVSAIPALAAAAAAAYLVPIQRAQRVWTSWLMIMPISALLLLTYSLKQFFLR
jgi:hypothetical protein